MSRGAGIGVNNIHRRTKDMDFGVNNIARKVLKAYIGVNGVARLFYTSAWWMASGLTPNNVIAAYTFHKAATQAEALKNNHTNNYPLTLAGNATWSLGNGIHIPHAASLDPNIPWGSGLTSGITTFASVIIKFKDVQQWMSAVSTSALVPMNRNRFLAVTGAFGWNPENKKPYYIYDTKDAGTARVAVMNVPDNSVAAGVIGVTHPTSLYLNGAAQQVILKEAYYEEPGNYYKTLGAGRPGRGYNNNLAKTIEAVAFYNVALTAAQHAEIYRQLISL